MALERQDPPTMGGMELLARITTGGMGEILLARKKGAHGFERLLALKIMRGDLARFEDMRKMFLDEARILARLDHPAIAHVYDFGEDGGVLYLAMEYVAGIPLSLLAKHRKAPIEPTVAARLVLEACHGLHAAHELRDVDGRSLGVVHRDISPQNLMLRFDGRLKILDFGVALVRDREAATTRAGFVKGKLAYSSPEQLLGVPVDRRTDVYSLAIVLYELLTGRMLFGENIGLITDPSRRGRIPRPSKLNRSVPRELDAIVMKGLAPKPKGRFSDAREMALALDRFVAEHGGETLEQFTERELATKKRDHDEWLRLVASDRRDLVTFGGIAPLEVEDPELPTPEGAPDAASSELSGALLQKAGLTRPTRAALFGALLLVLLGFLTAVFSGELMRIGASALGVAAQEPSETELVSTEDEEELFFDDLVVDSLEEQGGSSRPRDPDEPLAMIELAEPPPDTEPPVEERPKLHRASRTAWGALTVDARRGGTVFVGGDVFGRTPLRRARIAAGRHMVALRRPGDRSPRWASWVTVRSGSHVKIRLR